MTDRLRQVRAAVGALAASSAPADLAGRGWGDVLRTAAGCLCHSPPTGELTRELLRLIELFRQRHPEVETAADVPGVVWWLWRVHEGHGALPRRVTACVLAAWVNGMRKGTDPQPRHRCEGCRMILPDRGPDGEGSSWPGPCPCCGGQKIAKARWAGERLEWTV